MDETEEDVEEKGGYKLNKKGFRLEKEKKRKTRASSLSVIFTIVEI